MKDLALDAIAFVVFAVLLLITLPFAAVWRLIRGPLVWAGTRLADRMGFGDAE